MKFSAVLAVYLSLAGVAQAATITITLPLEPPLGVGPYGGADSYVEQGVTVSGHPGKFGSGTGIHLDDGGTSYSNYIGFSYARTFDAVSVDIQGLGQALFVVNSGQSGLNWLPIAYNNVLFQGFIGGVLTATQSYSTGIVPGLMNAVALGVAL